MEDEHRIDRLEDHGASSLGELSVELGQFKRAGEVTTMTSLFEVLNVA